MYKKEQKCRITYMVQNHSTLETDKIMLDCEE